MDGAGLFRAFCVDRAADEPELTDHRRLFAFLFAWSDLIFALTLTSKAEIVPVTLGIFPYSAPTSPTGVR